MEAKKEAEVKNYIQKNEQLNGNTVGDLASLDKEIKDGFLTEWTRNDAGLLKYADLAMKEEPLSFGETVKLNLLDLKLSLSCSYFSDFKIFLSKLKIGNHITDTNNPTIGIGSQSTETHDYKADSGNMGATDSKIESNNGKTVETAIQTAIQISEDNSYGYELGGTGDKNGKKGFDCQSFVRHCYIQAGINVPPSGGCGTMKRDFEKAGFECITFDKSLELKPGDILVDPKKHTEMCVGENKIAGAHSNKDRKAGDSGGEEISVRSIKSSLSYRNPKYILRFR